jgi:hypothetical protein
MQISIALILLPSKRPQHHTTTNTNKATHKQDEIVGGALLAVFLRHVICKDCEAKHSTRNHQKDFEKDVHGYSFVAVIVPRGIEPLSFAYQAKILPLKYGTSKVGRVWVEHTSFVRRGNLQSPGPPLPNLPSHYTACLHSHS